MTRQIFGSSLAALVAVLELSKSEDVIWVQTSPGIAGHFMGTEIEETNVDLGMVALEPYNERSNLESFTEVLPIRQAGLPFVQLGFEWLKAFGEEFKEVPVSILMHGKELPDYLIADDLSILKILDIETRQVILDQIQVILSEAELDNLHPKHKNSSDIFVESSLREILIATTGSQFYDSLIEPWFRKFNSKLVDFLPARDHRTAWVPMFYPETIQSAFIAKGPLNRLSRAFVVPKNSSVAGLVSRLIAKVVDSRVIVKKLGDVTEQPSTGDIVLTNTSDVMKLFSQEFDGNQFEYYDVPIAVLVLLFNEIVGQDFILNVVDESYGPYRVCSRNLSTAGNKSVVTLEFGEKFQNVSEEEIVALGHSLLAKLSLPFTYSSYKLKRAKIKVPYGLSRKKVEFDRNQAHQLMSANKVFGFPIDFGSSAFNDQVLLGLWSANAARSLK
jgi:hypothetical protein